MAWEGTYERLFLLALGSSYHVPSLANNIMNFLEGARLYKKIPLMLLPLYTNL